MTRSTAKFLCMGLAIASAGCESGASSVGTAAPALHAADPELLPSGAAGGAYVQISMSSGAILVSNGGGAQLYTRTMSGWGATKITLPNLGFGWALGGDVIVTTALPTAVAPDPSFVVLESTGSGWEITHTLPVKGLSEDGGRFHAAATDGQTAVIGAPSDIHDGASMGSAWTFNRAGTNWNNGYRIVASDGEYGAFFGEALSVDGAVLVVGASGASPAGAAYVFEPTGARWSMKTKLVPPSSSGISTSFGASVAASGSTVVVGSTLGAHVFEQKDGVWTGTQLVTVVDGFRHQVALHGDTLLVGAAASGSESLGRATLFERIEGRFVQRQDLPLPSAGAVRMVAINESRAVVGSGSETYVYQLRPSLPNGQTCETKEQCQSLFCVDGVCCDRECSGTCDACSAARKGAGTDGVCGSLEADLGPAGTCPDTCDSLGTARITSTGQRVECAPYRCVSGRCGDRCESVADCATGTCNAAGRCVEPSEPSEAGGCSLSRTTSSADDATWVGLLLVSVGGFRMSNRRRLRAQRPRIARTKTRR